MLAFPRSSCRALSKPRPALAPVMMIVLPVRLRGGLGLTGAWMKGIVEEAGSAKARAGFGNTCVRTGLV